MKFPLNQLQKHLSNLLNFMCTLITKMFVYNLGEKISRTRILILLSQTERVSKQKIFFRSFFLKKKSPVYYNYKFAYFYIICNNRKVKSKSIFLPFKFLFAYRLDICYISLPLSWNLIYLSYYGLTTTDWQQTDLKTPFHFYTSLFWWKQLVGKLVQLKA